MWSECIIDFIIYYLILDRGWDSEMYGTITAIQKFVPVVMNPFWVAMAEVAPPRMDSLTTSHVGDTRE